MSQPTLVALDIETTGLDAQRDAIIEIGAIRFRGDRIEGEFHTLLNPGRSIPRNVVELTGITDAMVARAPRADDKLPELAEFVGDDPVVGHNVRFDLSFLRNGRVLRYNEGVDTYPIASTLMPTATRYNLGALARQLGIVLPATHRALDDTRVTVAVYQALYKQALALPLQTLAEIVNLQQDVDWGANLLFEEALRARSRELARGRAVPSASLEPRQPVKGLLPVAEPTPLDADALAQLLEPNGAFAKRFASYEFRPQQVKMLKAVARAFSESRHAMVEAGTGTGKSFAYLVPAAQWAVQNGQRVVVSTNTINLQEQLLHKDVPDVEAALGLGVRAALL
ncbi:MAG TPA: exonuclease domain-containing protein, partial [Anaerolineales bacterium]|nr:exonuclease domain-containing protein [Anaerolineales bacterium]